MPDFCAGRGRKNRSQVASTTARSACRPRRTRHTDRSRRPFLEEPVRNFRPAPRRCSSPMATAARSTTSTATSMSTWSARCCRTCWAIAIPTSIWRSGAADPRHQLQPARPSWRSELAERLVKHIPCAEMVRFGKNGTDATSAAVRLARASTGATGSCCCGYHGWQDWYIGATTRNLGVPAAVSRADSHVRLRRPRRHSKTLFASIRASLLRSSWSRSTPPSRPGLPAGHSKSSPTATARC